MPGSMVFTMTAGPVDLRHLSQWWRWTPGASWRHPGRSRQLARRPRRPPGRARRLRGRRGLRRVGGQGAADRGGVGAGGSRRPRRCRVRVGRRTGAPGRAVGELLARRLPVAPRRRLRLDRAGRLVSRPTATACTTWPATCGSGRRTGGRRGTPADSETSCCVPTRAPRTDDGGQLRPGPAAVPDPPQGRSRAARILCADSYCQRYRPAARRPQMIDTGMSHIGFRCIRRN